jgi:N-succinyldiaminopimelate aminotransferase
MTPPDSSAATDRMASRLHGLGTTVFAEMSALALRTGSVNLGQGFPDTDGPDTVIEAAVKALQSGRNQYAPGIGVPELRTAVAEHQRRFYGLDYDPDTEVVVTTGATEAIAAAMLALVEPGDEVVALEPYYDSYVAAIAMAAGVRVPVTLRPPDFALDVDALRAAVTPRTRVLLVNSPHNPTGAVLSDEELRAVAQVAVEHDLVVVTDEVYEHLTYDGAEHISLATLPGMAERTIVVSSAAKTFSVTGWKTGWACGPAELIVGVLAAKQFLTFVAGGPFQPAVAHAIDHELGWVRELREALSEKRLRLSAALADMGMRVYTSAGGYFVVADITPLGIADGVAFCRELPKRQGVAAVPVSVFADDTAAWNHLVRFTFCKRDETLDEGVRRLRRG